MTVSALLSDLASLVATLLALLAAAGGVLLIIDDRARREAEARRRRALGLADGGDKSRGAGTQEENRRRRSIEATLKQIEARQRTRARRGAHASLTGRLRQAGLAWSPAVLAAVCAATAAAVFVFGMGLAGLGAPVALAVAAIGGVALPYLFVGHRCAQRMKAFLGELPDALDVIVRGVRAGLPLGDCLRIIAEEGREPVRTEFRKLTEDLAVGLPIDQAAERLFDRAPLLEMRLLGIILAIQNRSGGNLSEAVGNLSRVLRDRKRMKSKVRAISTEATSSAAIIAALPLMVAGLMQFVAPDHVSLLYTTRMGQIGLGLGLAWMLVGVVVMRNMIRFEV